MSDSKFFRRSGHIGASANFVQSVDEVSSTIKAQGLAQPDSKIGEGLRLENRTSEQEAVFDHALQSINGLVKSITATLHFEHDRSTTGVSKEGNFLGVDRQADMMMRAEQASSYGYLMAVGHGALPGRELSFTAGSNATLMNGAALSGGRRSTLRSEAFNNINLRASVAFSMGFNAAVTRQTDVVMAWFPPIFIAPDQTTMEIQVSPLTVFNGARHALSADKTDFERREVARAFADGNILGRHETALIPVTRAANEAKLVDTGVIPNFQLVLGRRSVETNFIKFDTDVNLLALAATDALLATGAQSHRDTVEPGAKLWKIAMEVDGDIVELNLLDLKTTNFVGAQQGDQQEALLNTRLVVGLGKNLTQRDGSALTGALASLVTNDYRLSLSINVGGTLNVETGNVVVRTPSLKVEKLINAESNAEITGAALTTIVNALAGAEFLGWLPMAFRTNANRRQQGDIINSRRFNFHYVVPYRDPITAERPAHRQDEHDAQDLTNLLALVRVRIENEAIDAIVNADAQLAAYVDVRTSDIEKSDIVGLAQYYLLASYHYKQLNMQTELDSLTSSHRPRDIQSVLTMYIRDIASRLYTESQWKAGSDVQSGGTLPAPQLNILTDPIIARYLLEPGDLRTAGDFEFVVTTTLNYKVRGKIYLSFRQPGQEASNEPCIFNFGHLLMAPELVLAANMTREGSFYAETQVQPRYEFAIFAPVMARIDVNGIREVLSKVPAKVQLSGPGTLDEPFVVESVTPPGP